MFLEKIRLYERAVELTKELREIEKAIYHNSMETTDDIDRQEMLHGNLLDRLYVLDELVDRAELELDSYLEHGE